MKKHVITKSTLFWVVIILLVVCIILPLIVCKDYINTFASLFMAACSLITLIIAIFLFDKYGIERSLKDKNFAAVNSLMEDLLNLKVMIESSSHRLLCNINFQSNYNRYSDLSPEELSSQLFFSEEALYRFSDLLDKALKNLFLPPEIVKSIHPLSMSLEALCVEKKESISQIPNWVVYIMGQGLSKQSDQFFSPDTPISLQFFLDCLDGLKQSCKKWLMNNGGDGSINDTPYGIS